MSDPKLIVAMDFPEISTAQSFAENLDPKLCRLKIGNELFVLGGPAIVEGFQKQGFEIFLDLKFHDIPNTVASACKAAADMGVWMINVHTLGGLRMLEAAAEAITISQHKPKLIGVTILTSMDEDDLTGIGIEDRSADSVDRLVDLAQQAGLDGVVCSALEADRIRAKASEDFLRITPGIRPAGASSDDQKRVMSPTSAILAGANYLVVGRPITQAEDPGEVIEMVTAEINQAL